MSKWMLKDDLQMFDSESDQVHGIVVDNDGNIYFTLHGSIWKQNVDDEWNFDLVVQEKDVFLKPLTWNGSNTIYAADSENHKIYMYDLITGKLSLLAGTGENGRLDGDITECSFGYPCGLAMSNDIHLYVAEENAVRKINLKEGFVSTITFSFFGRMDLPNRGLDPRSIPIPTCIATDEKGTLFVADYCHLRTAVPDATRGFIITHMTSSIGSQPLQVTAMMCDKRQLFLVNQNNLTTMDLDSDAVTVHCEFKSTPLCLVKHGKYLYVGTETGIIRLEDAWNAERFMWIGKLKESAAYCPFAKLPREIIKEIALHLAEKKNKKRKAEEQEVNSQDGKKRAQQS